MRSGLSKGLFIRGKQCTKSLWLHKFKPELKDEVSEQQKAAFGAGTEVGELACDLFPGGVMVPFEGLSIAEQLARTRQAMDEGAETIYEASFEHDGIFVKVDILHKNGESWDIYEVKASTAVKPVHIDDVALQTFVLREAGISVGKVHLVHLNNQYCRNGNIVPQELFAIADLTGEAMGKQEEVASEIGRLKEMLAGEMPEVGIGPQCSSPYDCDFQGYCWKDVPKDSVFELNGKGIDPFAYYHRGMARLEDLPLDDLNRRQRLQVELHLCQGEQIDAAAIADFLEGLWYPLVHLDFETFMAPIPLFDNTRPYQQVPFQYSLHIQREQNGPIEHREYLATPGNDPRPGLIDGLLREIPQDACVLTYNMAFEKGRIKELARDFPDHAEGLNGILDRVRDLIVPFRKRHAYRWQQRGSSSIKKVLPAFVPELSYQGMPIADGGMAMAAYHLMCAETDPDRLAEIRRNLLAYCKLDTEAMVQLLAQLYKLAQA